MKKVKLAFIAMAILLSVGGAFATRAHLDCRYAQQYEAVGSGYQPVGEIGVSYVCLNSPESTCTYYLVGNNQYQACQIGAYFPLR